MVSNNFHLEQAYNTLIASTNEGFYLFKITSDNTGCLSVISQPSEPYCSVYKPYLIRMLSPNHYLFVTEKNNDPTLFTLDVNDGINLFPKSYTVMVFNMEQNKILLHFTIGHKIINIIVIDKYILIVTINQVLVYSQNILTNNNDPNNVAFVKTIHTFTNPNGICSAKCCKSSLVIATLGRTTGEIMICTLKKKSNLYIQAHTYNITNIALDEKCELVSTSSESGTLINIFDIANCTKVYQFRRGIFGTTIHSIEFDNTSNYIMCCSDNGTIHVFHLYDKCNNNVNQKNTTSSFSALGSIMPVCHSEWAYKLFKINPNVKSKCYFNKSNDKIDIYVTSNDFTYYVINDIEKNADQVIKHELNKLIEKK